MAEVNNDEIKLEFKNLKRVSAAGVDDAPITLFKNFFFNFYVDNCFSL